MQRLMRALVCINFICFSLYRVITLRERKLFLRRQTAAVVSLSSSGPADKAEEASRAKSALPRQHEP